MPKDGWDEFQPSPLSSAVPETTCDHATETPMWVTCVKYINNSIKFDSFSSLFVITIEK